MNRTRWAVSTCAVAAAALCLSAAPAAAQRATLRGQVVDTGSGQPVAHAAVYLDDFKRGVVADAQGRFEIGGLRPGTRAIWADAPGYDMEVSSVEVSGDSSRVTLRMEGNPVRLEALRVTTNRFDRRANAFAGPVRVYREADLSHMWYVTVGDMVESRANVRMVPCRYYSLGSCVYSRGSVSSSRVVVDEAPWIGGIEGLRTLLLAEVSRVEVYGNGRQIRVYTRQFMDWTAKRPYVPSPLALGF